MGVLFTFIQPCHPQRATSVPAGDDWQHEINFDGIRVQIHKLGDDVELYSRSGSRFSRRFPRLVEVLRQLPVKSAILDGEIVASDVAGMPDFWRLPTSGVRAARRFACGKHRAPKNLPDAIRIRCKVEKAPVAEVGSKPALNTYRWLCLEYFKSVRFRHLNKTTQAARRRVLESTFDEPLRPGTMETFAFLL